MKLKFADAVMLRGIVLTEEVWEIIQEKVDDLEGWDKINGMKCSFPQMEGKHILKIKVYILQCICNI